jgi:hypothetical protein
MVKCEVSFVIEDSSVVQGGAIIELVEGDNVVRIRIGQGKVSYKPASTATVRESPGNVGAHRVLT